MPKSKPNNTVVSIDGALVQRKPRRGPDEGCYVVKKVNIGLVTAQATNEVDKEKLKKLLFYQAKIMEMLDHEHIVRVYSSFLENGLFHIVMQYCDLGTLQRFLSNRKGELLSENTIHKWTAQITSAGRYLHEKKLLHRDIKSDNIFLANNAETVRLGDFGLDVNTSGLGPTSLGTWAHIAPEVLFGEEYSFKAEVWSLGIVVYEMAALQLPFPHASQIWLAIGLISESAEIAPISSQYSQGLQNLIFNKLLVRDKHKRASMVQVAADSYLEAEIEQVEAIMLEKRQKVNIDQKKVQVVNQTKNSDATNEKKTVTSLAGQLESDVITVMIKARLHAAEENKAVTSLTDSQYDKLMNAVRCGSAGDVRLLLDELGGVDCENSLGKALLLEAASKGHAEIVKLLLLDRQKQDDKLDFIPLNGKHTY